MQRRVTLFVLCSLLAVGVANSSTVRPVPFDALVSTADTILVGEVMNVRSEWETTRDGRAIITLVTFRVADVWKGSLGLVTQLEFLGGTIGQTSMVVSGVPQFAVGQRDVLFVGATVKTVSPIVGLMQGRMKIERDVNGVDRIRAFDGRSLTNTSEIGTLRGPVLGVPAPPMRLADFATAVRSQIAAARQR